MSVEAKSYRPTIVVTFTFPKDIQAEIGYKDVSIKELSKSAEASALSKAGSDPGALMQNLAAASVVKATDLDGVVKPISIADESIDIFMAAIGPKGRTLVGAAYAKVNQPDRSHSEDFLASGTSSVG